MFSNLILTGSTGFLGNIIFEKLNKYYHIITIGRNSTSENHINFNFSTGEKLNFKKKIDLVVHCAGKAHYVPRTETEKAEFFKVNELGTKNLLNALDANVKPNAFVFISTVAVYGLNSGRNIVENTPLSASDPYGRSKILAEELVQKWCKRNNVICTILRLPLVIGKEPKGNLASMIKGINKGYYINIGGGEARKSMVLAEDVAMFIPKVAPIGGIYNLTDGYHPSFYELSNLIAKQLGKSKPLNLPKVFIFLLAKIGDLLGNLSPINSSKFNKIISDLTFDDSKAIKQVDWKPNKILENFKVKML